MPRMFLSTRASNTQNRVFNYRRKTTDTVKHTEAENMTISSHFAARMSRGRGSRLGELRIQRLSKFE
jgi:hypothetical protein